MSKAEDAFSLMFDETTALQRKKEVDILVRFWCEDALKGVTKYLTLQAATDIKKIMAYQEKVHFCLSIVLAYLVVD